MRILQVIDSLHIGGAEKLLVDMIPLLVNKGLQVDVVLLNGEVTDFYRKLEEFKCCNIISLGRGYYNIGYFFKLYKLSKKYDVIHVHLFPAQYYISVLKLLRGISTKVIFTEHSTSNRRIQNKYFRQIEKMIYRQYDYVVCITNKVKEKLSSFSLIDNKKLVVIENGIDISRVREAQSLNRSDFGFNNNDTILIMIAGFRREKDQDTVIKSMKYLPENYKFMLVGDGERREELEKLVQDLNLNDRVFFLGIRSDVYNLLKMSDISILSSHWEGFGLVAVETMASGIPLIASNVDGLAQVVERGGILFQKGDENDLTEKILQLNDEVYYKQISKQGIEKATQYDINITIDRLVSLYSNC